MTTRVVPLPPSVADELLANAFVDDEMAPAERAAFEQRLAAEPALAAAVARLQALRRVLAERVPKTAASDAFRDRIARIGTPDAAVSAPAAGSRVRLFAGSTVDWRLLAATAVVAAGLGGLATQIALLRPPASAASAALVAVHQHALLATEPFEIASSDRHTVKPWFDAKLAISPPVSDLAGDGFPLAGGRIDVVGGRRVPVLIYRHRAHLLSVVAVPEPGGRDDGAAVIRTTRDGYAVLTWRGPDFRFSAISDVADSDLAAFVEKLRRAMRAG